MQQILVSNRENDRSSDESWITLPPEGWIKSISSSDESNTNNLLLIFMVNKREWERLSGLTCRSGGLC